MNTIKERIGIIVNSILFVMAAIISGWLFSIEVPVGAIFYGIVAVVSIMNGYMMIEGKETKELLNEAIENKIYHWETEPNRN
jgi:membrane protein implicated in regulation of membrane protease activity